MRHVFVPLVVYLKAGCQDQLAIITCPCQTPRVAFGRHRRSDRTLTNNLGVRFAPTDILLSSIPGFYTCSDILKIPKPETERASILTIDVLHRA